MPVKALAAKNSGLEPPDDDRQPAATVATAATSEKPATASLLSTTPCDKRGHRAATTSVTASAVVEARYIVNTASVVPSPLINTVLL